jgi:hypothetical protein
MLVVTVLVASWFASFTPCTARRLPDVNAALTIFGDARFLGEEAKEPDMSSASSASSPAASSNSNSTVGDGERERRPERGDPPSDPEYELPVLESVPPTKVTPDAAVSVSVVTPSFAVWMVPLTPPAAMSRPAAAAPSA